MRTLVFTCTRRHGGLDVSHWGLNRLKGHESEITWLVGDDLHEQRIGLYGTLDSLCDFKVSAFDSSIWRELDPVLYRTVAHAYNFAIEYAVTGGFDLFVSLQDYIFPPVDGLARFEKMNREFPDAIYTGLCSFSRRPERDSVVRPEGLYTVFDRPFHIMDTEPFERSWEDVREDSSVEYAERNPVEFETNWACIPVSVLENGEMRYNSDYDRGVAYENQDFSFKAERAGYPTIVDMRNHAISLDHKSFFPEDEERDVPMSNLSFHQKLWDNA